MNKLNLEYLREAFASNWKRYLGFAVAGLFLFAAGAATGHFVTPPKTVVEIKQVEKVVEKVVVQEKVVIQKVYVQAKKEKINEEITTTKHKDGTETTTTKREIATDTDTKENTDTTQEKVVYKDRIVEKLVEKLKIVDSKKLDWRVAAGVGVSIPYFLGQQSPGVPGLSGAVINVELDRRIIGPFWLGVHANSQGVLGLNLSGVF